ncbi:MAG: hypothetical protein JSV56_00625 [Methanomassiliicoccales archaeon]|nr:MAG: hypothetical protein JSV56_00625 [Methanomassiliicoccales archaeon]
MKSSSSYQYLFYYAIMIVMIGGLLTIPLASAAGVDADLHNVEVSALPSYQGRGGPIIVDAAVYVYGGCCYHLYAFEVTANLTVPESIEILEGPSPERYDEIDAPPGGAATIVHFKWKVKGYEEGSFNLSVKIDTKNCGSVENFVVIEIVGDCVISYPDLFPEQPSVDKENIISIFASTASEEMYVEDVKLFYILGEGFSEGIPKNDTLYLNNGEEKKAIMVNMEQDPYVPEQWMCKMKYETKNRINFWFVAKDDIGKNTTSPLYSMEIIDPQEVDSLVNIASIGLILGTVIGFIVIFIVQGFVAKKKDSKFSELKSTKESVKVKGVGKRYNIIHFSLLIISILTIIIALYLGMFGELIELVT